MKIKTITVQRVKNLGNYKSERLEMTAEVPDDGDDEAYVILLRSKVWRLLNGSLTDEVKENEEEDEELLEYYYY